MIYRYSKIMTININSVTWKCHNIKTHDSESQGQEETAIIRTRNKKNTRPLSELFTRKSVHEFTNNLVKRP